MFQTVPFLGLTFTIAPQAAWRDLLLSPPPGANFSYLVTPNVDHIVQLSRNPDLAPAYADADWRMCDSRVIEKLARLRRVELACYPGADLVRDLLNDPRARRLKIAVIGPDAANFDLLRKKFPTLDLHLVVAPFMAPGSPEWNATLSAAEDLQADLTLLCISFPKQEFFAHDLKLRGQARGRAICAGASIDFLTGQQKRAPEFFRRTSTEWLYRLFSQPGRLWKRYLIDGPRIFVIYLRTSDK